MTPPRKEEPRSSVCTPCRGTGHLISGLGGTPHQVTCPWCRGTGEFIPGLDAQQSLAEGGEARSQPAEPAEPAGEAPAPPSEG